MKKVLLFGNGISMRYTNDQYDNESLKRKFINNLEFLSMHDVDNFNYKVKDLKNNIEELLKQKFNEEIFFKLFKEICINGIEQFNLQKNDYKIRGYKDATDVFERYYNATKSDKMLIDTFKLFPLKESYKILYKLIALTITFDDKNNSLIKIKYSNSFLSHLNYYDVKITTNYYTDYLENINYLHGVFEISNHQYIKNKTDFSNSMKNIVIDLYKDNSENPILFAEKEHDKVFLKSILITNSYNNLLIQKQPKLSDYIKDDDYEIDIVGLSIYGDKHIINEICKNAKVINIYCNSLDSQEKWKNETINYKDKVNIYCNCKFKGFEREKTNCRCKFNSKINKKNS